MNIRHDIAVVQNEHNMRRMLSQQRPTGQQLITTWLQRGKGHYSTDTQQDYELEKDVEYGDDNTEQSKVAWKPRVRLRLKEELPAAPARDAIINSQGNNHLRTIKYNEVLNGGLLDNEVMTAFCSILEKGNNKRP